MHATHNLALAFLQKESSVCNSLQDVILTEYVGGRSERWGLGKWTDGKQEPPARKAGRWAEDRYSGPEGGQRAGEWAGKRAEGRG